MRHTLRHLTLVAAALCIGACAHEPTAVEPDQAALDAAVQFLQIGDDVESAGADPAVADGYREIGLALIRAGRVSPITIAIDGASTDFLAAAQQFEFDPGPTCSQPGSLCLLLPPMRSVIAWQKNNPRRVVQLTSPAGGTATLPSSDFTVTRITYFDGSGGVYVGDAGSQALGAPQLSDVPCYAPLPALSGSTVSYSMEQCTRAEFPVAVSGMVSPPPFLLRNNTAAGTHAIVIASQSVHGVRVVLTPPNDAVPCASCSPIFPLLMVPPIDLRGSALQATLEMAPTAGDVALTLHVVNPSPNPVTISFSSGQQFDMRVRRSDGTIVWTWSADKAFIAALTSRTLAGGESATYRVSWTPTVHGPLIAEGFLTSSSHQASARMGFLVP
jgi:hypothetical protein